MSSDAIAKWLGLSVTVGTALIALFTRVVALEDAKNGHADVLVEHRTELRKLAESVSELERERWSATTKMLERVHEIENRLGRIEELLRDDRKERRRR